MNIHCPNCENECSGAAATCPKCGHPFNEKSERRWEGFRGEIGVLRITGLGAMISGIAMAMLGGLVGMQLIPGGIALLVFGLVIRALGGIWATLEAIERK